MFVEDRLSLIPHLGWNNEYFEMKFYVTVFRHWQVGKEQRETAGITLEPQIMTEKVTFDNQGQEIIIIGIHLEVILTLLPSSSRNVVQFCQ